VSESRWSFGCLSVLGFLALALLVSITGVIAIALTGMESESLGVTATYVMSMPMGAVWSALFVALAVYLFTDHTKTKKLTHLAPPLGCGCLGAILVPVLVWVFFTGIWPSL